MNIKFVNKEEQTQLLTILFSLGYKWHGDDELTTPEQVIPRWDHCGFDTIGIYGSDMRSMNFSKSYRGDELSWIKDSAYILSRLTNFKKAAPPSKVRVNNVGDFHAIITKDVVSIYGEDIPHEKIEEVYKAMVNCSHSKVENTRMNITAESDVEHIALMAIINSLGWVYSTQDESYKTVHDNMKSYRSIVVYDDMTIGGNYRFSGGDEREWVFKNDITEIFQKLVAMSKVFTKGEDIGSYTVMIYNNVVQVGCQEISIEKVKEIVDVIDTFKH